MLSILIPIYEVKVEKLVTRLIKQCRASKIEFEIICFDDGSSEKVKTANKVIDLIMGVNYVELSENKGRAKIRNLLAKMARYEYLLFLDCDSKISGKKFIKKYVSVLNEKKIICGGRKYNKRPPLNEKKYLHWLYGTKRESRSLSYRNKKKVEFFHSNNFVVHRNTFRESLFDETIRGYGYEDLALAHHIIGRGIQIEHIDNPTIHEGLETAQEFIDKSINATRNLWILYQEDRIPNTRLIKAYKFLDQFYIKHLFLKSTANRKEKLIFNLKSSSPKIYNLDLLKLIHLCELSIQGKKDRN